MKGLRVLPVGIRNPLLARKGPLKDGGGYPPCGEGSRLLSLEDALALSAQEDLAAFPAAIGTFITDLSVMEESILSRDTCRSGRDTRGMIKDLPVDCIGSGAATEVAVSLATVTVMLEDTLGNTVAVTVVTVLPTGERGAISGHGPPAEDHQRTPTPTV